MNLKSVNLQRKQQDINILTVSYSLFQLVANGLGYDFGVD